MQVFNQQHKEYVDNLITELKNDLRKFELDQGLSAAKFVEKYDNSYANSNPFIAEQSLSYSLLMSEFKDAFLEKENNEYLKFKEYLNDFADAKDEKDIVSMLTKIESNINKNSIENSYVDTNARGELMEYYLDYNEDIEQQKVAKLCETLFRHKDDERSLVEVLTENEQLECYICAFDNFEDEEKFILNFKLNDSNKLISIPLQFTTIERNVLGEDLSPYFDEEGQKCLFYKAFNYGDLISLDVNYSYKRQPLDTHEAMRVNSLRNNHDYILEHPHDEETFDKFCKEYLDSFSQCGDIAKYELSLAFNHCCAHVINKYLCEKDVNHDIVDKMIDTIEKSEAYATATLVCKLVEESLISPGKAVDMIGRTNNYSNEHLRR